MGNWISWKGESGEAEEILGWKCPNFYERCKHIQNYTKAYYDVELRSVSHDGLHAPALDLKLGPDVHKKSCTQMFIATLFLLAPNWRHSDFHQS